MDLLTSSEALQHCRLLSNLIDEEIQKKGGWLSFADFMDLVLYTPELGYYTGGAFKFGEKGDFITAPEISPLFGACIATTIAPVLDYLKQQGSVAVILELGAGSGKLCEDILMQLAKTDQLPHIYQILEVSPELMTRQKERLLRFVKDQGLLIDIQWVSSMPTQIRGVILANEVLDAVPVDLIIKDQDAWFEWGITKNLHPSSPSFSDHWQYIKGQKVSTLELPSYLTQHEQTYPHGYVTEVHTRAQALIRHIADALQQGIFVSFDYGFPEHEYYHPQRVQGTHIAHHRHHAIPDMFFLPGLCDLTAHVEWTSINRTAISNQLQQIYYQSQGAYLLETGIAEIFMREIDPTNTKAYTLAASGLQKLISEAEMGELFKVLAWSKNPSEDSKFNALCADLPGFTGRMRLLEA
jgi:SAM-dependent MidA family methyltransferase